MSDSDSPLKLRALFMFSIVITLYCCLSLLAVYKPDFVCPPSKAVSVFVLLKPGAMPAYMKHLKRHLAEALKNHEVVRAFKSELHSSYCGLWP